MTFNEVIGYFGSQANLCRALNLPHQEPSRWKARGFIPIKRQLQLQEFTDCKLIARTCDGVKEKNDRG